MRLHRLELSAFLAFPGREEVDFDALGESGLFLLHGRTGAGKTALLDAVCFAFYGEVPGLRSEAARLRSDHAAPEMPTEVRLEATLRGRRVRITRAPEQERPKLRGSGTTATPHRVEVVALDEHGAETVLATRPDEARRELGDLLGMRREQFCQVVLLPQGGFARFLQARSDEREALLRELFEVGRFADVEEWLRDRRREAERAVDGAMAGVRALLDRTAQAAGSEPPEEWEAAPEGAGAWLEEQLIVAEASETTAHEACREEAARRDRAVRALADGSAVAALQEEHARARAGLVDWESGRGDRDAAEEELAAARRAAPVQAHLEQLDARARAAREAAEEAAAACRDAERAGVALAGAAPGSDRAAALLRATAAELRGQAGAAGALAEAEAAVEAAAREATGLRRKAAALAADGRRLAEEATRLEDRRPELIGAVGRARDAAARLEALRGIAAEARRRADAAEPRDRLRTELLDLLDRHLAAREAAVAAAEEHATLVERRLDGMAAELAARLVEGQACAVCGSCDHPAPAGAPEDGLVDAATVAAAQDRAERLAFQRDDAAHEVDRLETQLSTLRAAAGDEPLEVLRVASAAGAQALATAEDAAGGLQAAERAVADLETSLASLAERRRRAEVAAGEAAAGARQLAAAVQDDRVAVHAARAGGSSIAARVRALTDAADAAEDAARAREAADSSAAEAREAQARALAAAAAAGFAGLGAARAALRDPVTSADLEERVRAWDAGLAARRAAVSRPEPAEAAARPAPDLSGLQSAAAAAEGAAEDARRTLVLAQRRRGELGVLRSRLSSALEAAGPARERFAVIRELADLAAGTSASNRLRMRLSAYVLAARLEEVAAAATLRLSAMSGGRYALEHADDGARGNRRGGLDLRVVDAWTGRHRAPSTLSGGETFLASLALALGLADVVATEAGGARLETLFVDEGFGSLDDEGTLEEVLDVLDGLRDGGRVVGVVSHVAELRQRIPVRLRIERGRDGSRVVAPGAVAGGP